MQYQEETIQMQIFLTSLPDHPSPKKSRFRPHLDDRRYYDDRQILCPVYVQYLDGGFAQMNKV
jgi:hypothetical protein